MKLFVDIETIPLSDKDLWLLKESYDEVKPKDLTFDDYVRLTSLSGDWGRIFCIGYARDDEPPQILCQREEDMLVKFWELAKGTKVFVGHYILGFDLPFLYRRSAALKIEPSVYLTPAKRKQMVHDTRDLWRWANQGSRVRSSLDSLARHFGIKSSKERMSGKEVWYYYKTGRLDEICDYCKLDVDVTRQIYKKLSVYAAPSK